MKNGLKNTTGSLQKKVRNKNKDTSYINLTALEEESNHQTQSVLSSAKYSQRLKPMRLRSKKPKKVKNLVINDTDSNRTTTYHFKTPSRKFDVNIQLDQSFPMIAHNLSKFNKQNIRIKGSASRKPSKNRLHLSTDLVNAFAPNISLNVSNLPDIKWAKIQKDLSPPRNRYSSNVVHKAAKDGFISQQYTLDPGVLLEARKDVTKDMKKNISFNAQIEPAKLRETASDRSDVFSKKQFSVKNIQMPKVSPFAKSIPIKKHGIKLFSEEDDYLCNWFKSMCGSNAGENIRNYRLNRSSFKNFLAKRYKSKIAETIVSCFDFSMPWDHVNYFEGLEVFVNNPEDSLRKMLFNAMDFNGDSYISEIDLFVLMRTLDSDIFVTVACKDVIELVNFLHQKKKDKGMDDPIANRMRKLEKDSIELKNKAYKKALGLDTARSGDSDSGGK